MIMKCSAIKTEQEDQTAILPLMPHIEGSTEKGDKENAYCV